VILNSPVAVSNENGVAIEDEYGVPAAFRRVNELN
jgi:hypothetical protein